MVNQRFLTTLDNHRGQIITSFLSYSAVQWIFAPLVSKLIAPTTYNSLPPRTRLNWNIRVVSLVQSIFICWCALDVIFTQSDRSIMTATDRLWSYSPASGKVQAYAAGYFMWDLLVSATFFDMLGVGSLIHAISALLITMLGFRPFANFYGINFVLYELSTPFLNFHWFMDKLEMTGSTYQLVNGVVLMVSFFGCRIAWGWYQSFCLYQDAWKAWTFDTIDGSVKAQPVDVTLSERDKTIDFRLTCVFVVANTILSALNLYWFWLMIKSFQRRSKSAKNPITKKSQ